MLPSGHLRASSRPSRLVRIAVAGVLSALTVLLVGWAARTVVIGRDDVDARARIDADVRASFDEMARALRDVAARATPSELPADVDSDPAALDRLFDLAAVAVSGHDDGLAVTIYDQDGTPLVWAGLPSELPRSRLVEPEAWFLADGIGGLRLFYVRALAEPKGRGPVVAVERAIPRAAPDTGHTSALGAAAARTFIFQTRVSPVIIAPVNANDVASSPAATVVASPLGRPLLTMTPVPNGVADAFAKWRRATTSFAFIIGAITAIVLAATWWDSTRGSRYRRNALGALGAGLLVIVARLFLRVASPADWWAHPAFSGAVYASPHAAPFLASPFDLVSTVIVLGAITGLVAVLVDTWRLTARSRRRAIDTVRARVTYTVCHLGVGVVVSAVALGHEAIIRDTIQHSALDLLRFSLLHWDDARMTLHAGLILAHVSAVAVTVPVVRAAGVPWRLAPARTWVVTGRGFAWCLPLAAWIAWSGRPLSLGISLMLPTALGIVVAVGLTRLLGRFRHGSQSWRLGLLSLAVVAPTAVSYPLLFGLARDARAQLVETRYAPQAIRHRDTVFAQLEESLMQIDALPGIDRLASASVSSDGATDAAFNVWQATALSQYPVTSSVEIYRRDRTLASRFAFHLPEDLTAAPPSDERTCDWDVYEEVAPVFGEERRVIHAGRGLCERGTDAHVGSIVVHAMPDDFENLPFLASRSPYVELLRPTDTSRGEGLSERGVEYAVYGWSRRPLYASGPTAWGLPDDVFARIEGRRAAFWTELARGNERHDVYLLNDRSGIYALGFPVVPAVGHLLNLAEVTVLALGVGFTLLVVGMAIRAATGRTVRAPNLLRAVRASFYRKLFAAFVAAAFVPVMLLAIATRNYVADRVRANIEQEAVRTAAAAGRVVENLAAPQGTLTGARIEDNLLVFVSRLIDQDVNVFSAGRLVATSERNLFASRLLPTRTPAAVHHRLDIQRDAAAVTRERIGTLEYLVAATPLTGRQFAGVLTLPLPSRQQEIDAEIDTLDRQILLGAILVVLAGAGLGYYMAERISDPVNRLSRVTRRIARGDLTARTMATSADELGRLVDDFNGMAAELQRQRVALERTHRIEAWAEMARQVAHEIKNPLTPIQLSAEHVRRVHADRGAPLGTVVQDCVASILTQVTLLRQIASDFSSFASSPTAKPAEVDVAALVAETVAPYRVGLENRVRIEVVCAAQTPTVFVDRSLVARALTNIVENALHAMPDGGDLTVRVHADDTSVSISVVDTGHGMDDEALARAFEPYFSTKSRGTGLGLPIARRNIELNGGTLTIARAGERGTVVSMRLPRERRL